MKKVTIETGTRYKSSTEIPFWRQRCSRQEHMLHDSKLTFGGNGPLEIVEQNPSFPVALMLFVFHCKT